MCVLPSPSNPLSQCIHNPVLWQGTVCDPIFTEEYVFWYYWWVSELGFWFNTIYFRFHIKISSRCVRFFTCKNGYVIFGNNAKHQLMAHTEDYCTTPYNQWYCSILKYCLIIGWHLKTAVYGTLIEVVLRSIIDLYSDETYSAMTNYDGEDSDGNKDRNNDKNSVSISVSDSQLFYPIKVPWSREGISGNNGDGSYICGALYIYHCKDFP